MRAIDAFVNVNMGALGKPDFLVRVAEDYFKRAEHMFKSWEVGELLELMDRIGVEKSVITCVGDNLEERVLDFARKHPDRFGLSVYLDPRQGMKAVRVLETLAKNEPLVLARVTPFMINLPPDDRVYYPIYAKCVELDLPVSVNTGIPGPPAPGKCQDPIYLDEVCLFFPELKLVMAHGADPWWAVAIRLMLKYANLYLMTSAYAPKYFPPELIQFMNTRGADKILFASDHPVLSMDRCLEEAKALKVKEGVLDKFLYENSKRLFFSRG